MKRIVSIIIVLGLVGAGAIAAGSMIDDGPLPTTCSESYTAWEASEGMYDGSVPPQPLDPAIRQALRSIPVTVLESSIDRAEISASASQAEVRMEDDHGQPVVLHLKRLQDGYIDGSATWCAPTAES